MRVRLKHETEWREGGIADVYTFRNGKAIQMRISRQAAGSRMGWGQSLRCKLTNSQSLVRLLAGYQQRRDRGTNQGATGLGAASLR